MSYEERKRQIESETKIKEQVRSEYNDYKDRKNRWEMQSVNKKLMAEGYSYRDHCSAELVKIKPGSYPRMESRWAEDIGWFDRIKEPQPAKQSATTTPAIQSGTTTTKEENRMSGINYNRRDNHNRLKVESLTAEEQNLYRFMMGEGVKSEDALRNLAMAEDQQHQFDETQRLNQ